MLGFSGDKEEAAAEEVEKDENEEKEKRQEGESVKGGWRGEGSSQGGTGVETLRVEMFFSRKNKENIDGETRFAT